jgi:4-hydroxythreonine-4-phosphate dehydrogenase
LNGPGRNRIALSIGDPNGIGPEIAIMAARALASDPEIDILLVGDEHVLRFYAERLAPELLLESDDVAAGQALRIVSVNSLAKEAFTPGRGSSSSGRATVDYTAAAVRLVQEGRASAVVACPHSEAAVNAAGIPFSGYPGLLARLVGVEEREVFLMLVGGGLRIVHVTLHERLQSALARITPDLICKAGQAAVAALQSFGIPRPKIGLFGINPHAGEGGLFGQEDDQITTPAARSLRGLGIDVEGPIGADLMLGRSDIDAFVAMYHDQGHIPIKLLAGRNSAAMSVGAGFPFSSVGHGSAFDIAGQGIAEPDALLRCIRLVSGRNLLEAPIGAP